MPLLPPSVDAHEWAADAGLAPPPQQHGRLRARPTQAGDPAAFGAAASAMRRRTTGSQPGVPRSGVVEPPPAPQSQPVLSPAVVRWREEMDEVVSAAKAGHAECLWVDAHSPEFALEVPTVAHVYKALQYR